MSIVEQRNRATKYKYEAEWNGVDGWHFYFGTKQLWEIKTGYMVADLLPNDVISGDDCNSSGESYQNHEEFTDLSEALEYMRTGKR
jgi:hypothetical protein